MAISWDEGSTGVLRLPSGRLLRGRGLGGRGLGGRGLGGRGLGGRGLGGRLLRRPVPDPPPDFGLYLLSRKPREVPWPARWVRWPDFGLPADPADAAAALLVAWHRAGTERVEIACAGGLGRTGTALACLAVIDGVPPARAVAFVRERYHPRAVETRRQRRFVENFKTSPD